MTIREAITTLKDDIDIGAIKGRNLEAYEIAINALELEMENYERFNEILRYIELYQRPSAEWINGQICSNCRKIPHTDHKGAINVGYRYCAYCGAKMGGKND